MSITSPDPPELRDATAAELRALGHPLRLRILRLALDRPLTNKQLAERLDEDPGTVLHHVKTLVRTGFLAADPERRGRRGAVERPYRSTGKSWQVRMGRSAGQTATVIDAVRDELLEAGEDAPLAMLRLGVRLKPEDLAELRARISQLGDDFVRRDEPAGTPVGILAIVHRRRP